MGMFDSLYITIDHHDVELQTKQFDCVLGHYALGSPISGASGGIAIFHDQVRLDSKGKHVYGHEEAEREFTVFIVLVHTIFTDYEVVVGALTREEIEARMDGLKNRWSDSFAVMLRWLDFLRDAEEEKRRLRGIISSAGAVIDYARKIKAGDDLSFERRFGLGLSAEKERLDKGDDVLEVLESVLQQKEAEAELFQGRASMRDAFEDSRL